MKIEKNFVIGICVVLFLFAVGYVSAEGTAECSNRGIRLFWKRTARRVMGQQVLLRMTILLDRDAMV